MGKENGSWSIGKTSEEIRQIIEEVANCGNCDLHLVNMLGANGLIEYHLRDHRHDNQ